MTDLPARPAAAPLGWAMVAVLVVAGAAALLSGSPAGALTSPPGPPAVAAGPDHHLHAAAAADPSPQEVRRVTREVLSGRAYAPLERSWWQRWRDRARAWLAERVLALVGGTSGTLVAWVIVAAGVIVAGLVAVRLVRGTVHDPGTAAAGVDLERRAADDWWRSSREAEARGDLREAVRTGFRALVASYAEAGLVAEVAGRTVGEYRADVRLAAPTRAPAFQRASELVEAVLYADRPATVEDLAAIREAMPLPTGARA